MSEKKFTVTRDTVIGDVLDNVPGAMSVIEKYFGQGCFTCPGMRVESLAFGAAMHNMDPDAIVREIEAITEKESA